MALVSDAAEPDTWVDTPNPWDDEGWSPTLERDLIHGSPDEARHAHRARRALALAYQRGPKGNDGVPVRLKGEAAVAFKLGAAARCAAIEAGGPPSKGAARTRAMKLWRAFMLAAESVCGPGLTDSTDASCDALLTAFESGWCKPCNEQHPKVWCDRALNETDIEEMRRGQEPPLTERQPIGPYEVARPHVVGSVAGCWYSPETQERLRLQWLTADDNPRAKPEALENLIRKAEAKHPLSSAWEAADRAALDATAYRWRNVHTYGAREQAKALREIMKRPHIAAPSVLVDLGIPEDFLLSRSDNSENVDVIRDHLVTLDRELADATKRTKIAENKRRRGQPRGKPGESKTAAKARGVAARKAARLKVQSDKAERREARERKAAENSKGPTARSKPKSKSKAAA